MKTKRWMVAALILGLAIGVWWGSSRGGHDDHAAGPVDAGADTIYTCSMHPQIRQPEPGVCPLCAMDLIPVAEDGRADVGPRAIYLSDAARELARIETSPVIRGEAVAELRLSGILDYDTTRIRNVILLRGGQVRTLFANVVGDTVAQGDPLAVIYSPEVFAASRELVVAGQSGGEVLAESARRKLALLGMSAAEIDRIAETGEAIDTFTLLSPIDGVVTGVEAWEGGWVDSGKTLLTVADRSSLWALFDVYEQDMAMISVGQEVGLSVEAFPGEVIEGVVSFVPAELDRATRSVKVRVDVPNVDLRIKPGMFVRGMVKAVAGEDALLVPVTAVLRTGKRAVVYVESPDDPGVFEGRVITLGPRAGDSMVVVSGLSEGERVASQGALRIDSSLQLLAKPSMMSLPSDGAATRPQTHCPIGGGEIDVNDYVDYQGYRIYFCCPGCDEEFLRDPEKHLEDMRAAGIELERTPTAGGGGHDHH